MVTTQSLRDFAAECLRGACKTDDPSQRQFMLDSARCWATTADVIDRCLEEGGRGPDLRSKLN